MRDYEKQLNATEDLCIHEFNEHDNFGYGIRQKCINCTVRYNNKYTYVYNVLLNIVKPN